MHYSTIASSKITAPAALSGVRLFSVTTTEQTENCYSKIPFFIHFSLNLIRANLLFRILPRHYRKSLHDFIHIQGIKAAPKIIVYPGGNITYSN